MFVCSTAGAPTNMNEHISKYVQFCEPLEEIPYGNFQSTKESTEILEARQVTLRLDGPLCEQTVTRWQLTLSHAAFGFHTSLTFFMLDSCFQSNTETQ